MKTSLNIKMDLSGKEILLVGEGWLGKQLGIGLREAGANVTLSSSPIRLLDFSEHKLIAKLTKNFDIAIATLPLKALNRNNVIGLSDLPVGHWVFMSSTGVYASGDWDEAGTTLEDHPYRKGELALLEELDNLTICRLAGLIGGDRNPGNFFKRGVIPNAQNAINLIHGQDIVELLCSSLSEVVSNRLLNFVNPAHPNKGAYYQKMAKKQGSSLTTTISDQPNKIINSNIFNAENFNFTNLETL